MARLCALVHAEVSRVENGHPIVVQDVARSATLQYPHQNSTSGSNVVRKCVPFGRHTGFLGEGEAFEHALVHQSELVGAVGGQLGSLRLELALVFSEA